MPCRPEIPSILIIGAGTIVFGRAAPSDPLERQAERALEVEAGPGLGKLPNGLS